MKEEELREIKHAQMRNAWEMFVGKPQGKKQLGLHVYIEV